MTGMNKKKTLCKAPAFTQIYIDWSEVPALMTVDELACLLRTSENTILNHINAGDFAARKIGREWRIEKSSVRRFFEGNQTIPEDPRIEAILSGLDRLISQAAKI